MKYYEVSFNIKAPTAVMQDARDIVSALAGEAGFETFEDTDEGVKGYVQQELFDRQVLDALLGGVPIDRVKVRYEVAEAEDRDGYMHFRSRGSKPAADIVKGLKLHLEQLAQQYPAFVTITTEE